MGERLRWVGSWTSRLLSFQPILGQMRCQTYHTASTSCESRRNAAAALKGHFGTVLLSLIRKGGMISAVSATPGQGATRLTKID